MEPLSIRRAELRPPGREEARRGREENGMRSTQRMVIPLIAAVAGLASAATAMAPAASASVAAGTAGAGSCGVAATIPVGAGPIGVATDPRTNTIYVTNGPADTVSAISGNTNTVTATIPVGAGPIAVAANRKTN